MKIEFQNEMAQRHLMDDLEKMLAVRPRITGGWVETKNFGLVKFGEPTQLPSPEEYERLKRENERLKEELKGKE